MKKILFHVTVIFLIACGGNESHTESKTVSTTESAAPVASQSNQAANESQPAKTASAAKVSGPELAHIDMGTYLFRIHDITQYHPSGMQSKMMKWDDSQKDYFIIDCSIQNKTGNVVDVGINALSVYFTLSDGSAFSNKLRSGGILASFNTDNKQRYPQKQYDLMWSNQFPANGTARAHAYAVEAPEGITITGVGFHQKSKEKNKFVSLN